jgi:hypothetical protein
MGIGKESPDEPFYAVAADHHLRECPSMKDRSTRNGKNDYSISVLRTVQEVKEIRSIWESMQWHPNADMDFYLTIVNARPEIVRPHVIVLFENGCARAIMVGRVEETRLNFQIGYKSILRPKVRLIAIIYGGLLGDISRDAADALVSELIKSLYRGEAEVVFFSHLPWGSDICQIARTKPIFLCRDHMPIVNAHWKLALPSTMSEFWQSINPHRRHELRRYSRVIERKFPGELEFKLFEKPEQVENLCNDLEEIAQKTYQRGLGAGFVYDDENLHRMSLSANRGWLRAYLLYINKRPCAFWAGTLYEDVFYLDFTGYDPQFRQYEPGTVLLVRMIEDLCQHGIRKVDFGYGEAFYKQRFCNESWREASVYIFSTEIRSILINIMRTLVVSASNLAEKTLKRVNYLNKLKKYWRIMLTPR